MPPYLPQTEDDQRVMLDTIGFQSIEQLFEDIPEEFRFPELNLPQAASELEVLDELYGMALKNSTTGCFAAFIG
ncbi:MAG: glycine dehydrogenase, partial [Anaerolineales bacterium]|nr:glycine dehydrogenase [Anaerolineales bacterium]